MMSQEQAAKYFIIGWVKGWSLWMYWLTVSEAQIGHNNSENSISEAHKNYSWLPVDGFMYSRKVTCQRYIGDNLKKLNDSLYSASDNAERLKFWTLVVAHNGENCRNKANKKFTKDRQAMRKEDKKDKRTHQATALTVDAMRRGSGHAWDVCK